MIDTIVLAGGCFWCTEAIFQRTKGVVNVISGYANGDESTANYIDVASGKTNHAESVKVDFNSEEIDLRDIIKIFMVTHDPTSLNKQGYDIGRQYRSAIFYIRQDQQVVISEVLKSLQNDFYDKKIVTEVEELTFFEESEEFHQDFYNKNTRPEYCRFIIDPKLTILKENFKSNYSEVSG